MGLSAALGWHATTAVLLAFPVIGSCRSASPTAQPNDRIPRGAIVVVIDTLRADRLGAYGNQRNTSPNMDALAADGTRFENAYTAAPWTLPSMGSLWTSLYPSVHGAVEMTGEFMLRTDPKNFHPRSILADSRVTLAEVLRSHGFATAAFIDGVYSGTKFGFGQGFDHVVEDEVDGVRLNVEALLQWLDETRPVRFFGYVHVLEVHSPYVPKDPVDRRPQTASAAPQVIAEERRRYQTFDFDPGYTGTVDGSRPTLEEIRKAQQLPQRDLDHLFALYDRGIAYIDYWIGELVRGLKERGLYDQTVLVVTADHGEEFLEHGGTEHGPTFYDEVLHIPLIIRVAGREIGAHPDAQVSLVDVMPTLLDLLGVVDHDVTMQGTSLVPVFEGRSLPDRPIFAEANQGRPKIAMRTARLKYVQRVDGLGREVYDLRSDKAERENLCAENPGGCDSFSDAVDAWRTETHAVAARLRLPRAPNAVIDAAAQERLRELGYER